MLDLNKVKNFGQSMTRKVADKAAEVNARASQRTPGEDQYVVGLDIGTEFVKALIGRVRAGGIEIIGVGRQHQALSDMQAGAIADIGRVVQNCDKALAAAEQQAGVSARTAVLGIAGELV
jgi:cell division protein FtsA